MRGLLVFLPCPPRFFSRSASTMHLFRRVHIKARAVAKVPLAVVVLGSVGDAIAAGRRVGAHQADVLRSGDLDRAPLGDKVRMIAREATRTAGAGGGGRLKVSIWLGSWTRGPRRRRRPMARARRKVDLPPSPPPPLPNLRKIIQHARSIRPLRSGLGQVQRKGHVAGEDVGRVRAGEDAAAKGHVLLCDLGSLAAIGLLSTGVYPSICRGARHGTTRSVWFGKGERGRVVAERERERVD